MDGTIFIAAFYSFVWSGLLDLYFHEFFKEKSMLIEEDVDKEKKQIQTILDGEEIILGPKLMDEMNQKNGTETVGGLELCFRIISI